MTLREQIVEKFRERVLSEDAIAKKMTKVDRLFTRLAEHEPVTLVIDGPPIPTRDLLDTE